MNIKRKEKFILTSEESDFLYKLIAENQKCLQAIIKKNLGVTYEYLLDDAISELYLLACSKIKTLKTHPYPLKWMIVSAKLVAKGCIKKHTNDLNTATLDEIPQQKSDTNLEEDAIYNIWLENKIPEKIITQLSKREREVYIKIYIEDKSIKFISKEMQISENNVRNIHKNLRDKIYDAIHRKNF